MLAVVTQFCFWLDEIRGQALSTTLAFEPVRDIFRSRALRLFALYLLAVGLYLPLSLFLPLWVLAIGPVIWGLPHLFASFRYIGFSFSNSGAERQRAFQF